MAFSLVSHECFLFYKNDFDIFIKKPILYTISLEQGKNKNIANAEENFLILIKKSVTVIDWNVNT